LSLQGIPSASAKEEASEHLISQHQLEPAPSETLDRRSDGERALSCVSLMRSWNGISWIMMLLVEGDGYSSIR